MKSILLTMFLLIGFNSFTQDTIITNKGRLELIADELDISEEQAYQSLVKEQRIQAYRNLMIYLTMFIGLVGMRKCLKRGDEDRPERERYGEIEKGEWKVKWIIPTIITSLMFVVSLVYNAVEMADTFTGLFNPEYGALEQLEFLNK